MLGRGRPGLEGLGVLRDGPAPLPQFGIGAPDIRTKGLQPISVAMRLQSGDEFEGRGWRLSAPLGAGLPTPPPFSSRPASRRSSAMVVASVWPSMYCMA